MQFEQFGAYRIEALLGRGGMGDVYRAYDTEHDRTVALKVLSQNLASDRGYRERFRREAHLAARLNEPHIVPIHRYGEIEGHLFLDMRLVPGRDVAAVLVQEGPMDPARAVSVISQVARALDAAHADGLIHRDVKPSNILVSGDGDDEFVYLVDFGIARSTTDQTGPALTQTGAALGSFDYMAPERYLEKDIDRRVDVYALGCVLFECLTGRRPFVGDALPVLMYAHLNTEPPAPSSLRPELPKALDAVVAKALAKSPDDRYSTAGEMAAAARAALREAGMTPAPEVRVPAAPPTAVHPVEFPLQTVGFSNPGPGGGYGPPSDPGGAYGPPSNPGVGYGPPSNPGVGYGPPSNPGVGYGPPSQPGSPGYAQPFAPVPPPSGPRTRNPLPIILAAAGLVVILVVVLIVVLVTKNSGGGGGGQASGTTAAATGSTAPASTSPSTSPTSSEPASSEPVSTTAGGGSESDLLAIIPGGFDRGRCRTQDPAGDGDLAALGCGASGVQPGPSDSAFYLYPDAKTADSVFLEDASGYSLSELPDGTNCPDQQGYQNYNDSDGNYAGRLACFVRSDDNASVLFWTQDEFGAEAYVTLKDGGTAGLTTLMDWWREPSNSDFGS